MIPALIQGCFDGRGGVDGESDVTQWAMARNSIARLYSLPREHTRKKCCDIQTIRAYASIDAFVCSAFRPICC